MNIGKFNITFNNVLKIVNNKTMCRFKEIRKDRNHINTQTNCKHDLIRNVHFKTFHLKVHKRDFHTTSPNKALPPVLWYVIQSVLKITAMLTGKGLRMWWARLPPSEKLRMMNRIQANRPRLWLGSFAFGGWVSFYYVSHLVEDPITKRKRFLLFSEKQIIDLANMECEFILKAFKNKITRSGNQYETVLKTSQRIVQSNKRYPGVLKKWQVFVIDDIDKRNAFVLPSGHIFIFTGMMKVLKNEDQLAVILAHEMAHALLNHSAEIISKTHFFSLVMLLPIFIIWTLLPDLVAFSSQIFIEAITTILFRLPMNRRMEVEADIVGLMMAARACYDPRQAAVFWKQMEDLGEAEMTEWLSTHPRYKTRYETLKKRMPEALSIRDRHCSKPDIMDPRN